MLLAFRSVSTGLVAAAEFVSRQAVLSLLWTVCSLPVLTIGASTIALIEMSDRTADDRGPVVRDFLGSVRRHFAPGLGLTAIVSGAVAVVALEAVALRSVPEEFRVVSGGLIIATMVLGALAVIQVPAMLAAGARGLTAWRSALRLTVAAPWWAAAGCIVVAFAVQLCLVTPVFLPLGGAGLVALFLVLIHGRAHAGLAGIGAHHTETGEAAR